MIKLLCAILIFLIVSNSFETVSSLNCWRCSSDSSTQNYCFEYLDELLIEPGMRRFAYVNCENSMKYDESTHKVVCVKEKLLIHGEVVFTRNCAIETIEDPTEACSEFSLKRPSFITAQKCTTCETDGCNI